MDDLGLRPERLHFSFQTGLTKESVRLKVTPAVHHSWAEVWRGLQILPHMFGEGTEGRRLFWDAPIWPGRVVILRYHPGVGTVSLEHKVFSLVLFIHAAFESNLPETKLGVSKPSP